MKKYLFCLIIISVIALPGVAFGDAGTDATYDPNLSREEQRDYITGTTEAGVATTNEAIADLGGLSAVTGLSAGTGTNPVLGLLNTVALFLTSIIATIAILMIAVSGIMYITSGGDQQRAESAKKMLTYAIVGLIVSLLAYVIVWSVSNMLEAGGGSSTQSTSS